MIFFIAAKDILKYPRIVEFFIEYQSGLFHRRDDLSTIDISINGGAV